MWVNHVAVNCIWMEPGTIGQATTSLGEVCHVAFHKFNLCVLDGGVFGRLGVGVCQFIHIYVLVDRKQGVVLPIQEPNWLK